MILLRGEGGRAVRPERPGRFAVRSPRRDRDELALGVTLRGQLAAEHATGVHVHRAVEPLRLGHRRVAVHHRRGTAALRRPVPPNREPELVGLAGRLAVEREVPHEARTSPFREITRVLQRRFG